MAHKKGVGSSKNGRESASKRLGVKIWGGQYTCRRCCSVQERPQGQKLCFSNPRPGES